MKKLLTILVVVLGTMTMVNGQGWMFFSAEEVREKLTEDQIDYDITEGITEDSTVYMMLDREWHTWILFFDSDANTVFESHFISNNYNMFVIAIDELNAPNNKMIKQGDGHWIHMRGSGAIDVRTDKQSYSDFPVFFYTYKRY